MGKKHKKVCMALNWDEHLLISVSGVTECVLISAFDSLVGVSTGIGSFTVGLKIWAITSGIKMYKPIFKKKEETC